MEAGEVNRHVLRTLKAGTFWRGTRDILTRLTPKRGLQSQTYQVKSGLRNVRGKWWTEEQVAAA